MCWLYFIYGGVSVPDTVINEFRRRRALRLAERGIAEPKYKKAYRKGSGAVKISKKELLKDLFHLDAPEDEGEQNNNNRRGGSSGGGHGNTRLPFGLCKRFGIEIGDGWTPKDAWDALAGKGITPDGAFERLKKGEDPGVPKEGGDDGSDPADTEETTKKPSINVEIGPDEYKVSGAKYVETGGVTGKPWVLEGSVPGYRDAVGELASFDTKRELLAFLKEQGVEEFPDPETGEILNPKEMELPKDPVKKVSAYGAEYDRLRGIYYSWAGRGRAPYRLEGHKIEGTGGEGYTPSGLWKSFYTKTDMLKYLKEQGVEEFLDPETKEVVNPKEMDLPETVFSDGERGYSDISIGFRKDRYTVVGTDFDGKKRTISDFKSLKDAQAYLASRGAKVEDVKLSPALKKREVARVAWLTSDKKEYFEDGGVKFGDLSINKDDYGEWSVTGESEDGEKRRKAFGSRGEMMKYLKDQGVESVREGKEKVNPQDVEIPETKVTLGGRPYQEAGFYISPYDDVYFQGKDLDGVWKRLSYKRRGETLGAFRERLEREFGITEADMTVSDEDREKLDAITKAEEEKERRRKEFESKAVDVPGRGRYMDIHIEKDTDGDLKIIGYDEDGDKRSVSSYGDMYDMGRYAERYGLNMEELIKDEDIRKEYDKYLDARRDFDAKAKEIAGDKYADISISYAGGVFKVRGYDERGRLKEFSRETSYEDLEKVLNQYGYTPDEFPMDDEATKRKDRAMKAKYAIATGDYYSLGKKDSAYKDIRVLEDDVGWKVLGTDPDGNEHVVEALKTWDEAITKMSDYGVNDYKLKDKTGAEIGKPRYGMHKVMLMRKPGGGFLVFADSKRYGTHAIMYETPKEEEARKWLRDNGVPDGSVKTRGMNPNDDVPRTHTAPSLKDFDAHRMQKVDGSIIDDLTDEEKKDAADMLTTVFDKGKLRSARGLGHFGDIIETGYKSQIETGTGGHGACLSKSARKRCSEIMYGHGDLGDADYEKMGYVGLEDDGEDYDHGRPSYGEMTFTWKKDRMNDRLTYTYGDSLNTDGHMACAGYGGDKPTIEGLTSLYNSKEIKRAVDAYKKYKNGEISYVEMFDRIRRDANNRYIEIQLHGPVTVEDIDTATFYSEKDLDRAFDKMGKGQRKRVIKLLRDNNVKVVYRKDRYKKFEDAWAHLREKYTDDFED